MIATPLVVGAGAGAALGWEGVGRFHPTDSGRNVPPGVEARAQQATPNRAGAGSGETRD
ncbi:MAG: hypothetical protein ACT4OZ_10275 [Gemmatimonadota bacterium]